MTGENMKIIAAALMLALACGCSPAGRRGDADPVEEEEARRTGLEMQSVMDMVSTSSIPPVDFETGSAILKTSSYDLLNRVADLLLRHTNLKLIVEGHTDDVGGEEVNETLSLKRAGAVKQYLAAKGIYPDSIRVYGYGSKRPVSEDRSLRGRALNRRVEFKITKRNWESVF